MQWASKYLTTAAALGLAAGLNSPAQAEQPAQPQKASAQISSASMTQVNHAQAGHIMLEPGDLKWQDGPPGLPAGSQFAVLEGDPTKPGPFTIRGKLPANYRIAPHTHPVDEHVTVLSGALYMGLGSQFSEAAAQELKPSAFAVMYVGTQHFAFTREPTIIQLHGIGPWGINYVNPADDPRRQTSTGGQ